MEFLVLYILLNIIEHCTIMVLIVGLMSYGEYLVVVRPTVMGHRAGITQAAASTNLASTLIIILNAIIPGSSKSD